MKLGTLPAVIGAVLLGACAYSVDEGWFFKPQPVSNKASSIEELGLDNEERLTQPGKYSTDMARISPNLSQRLPATVSHDFISLGGQRIAVSRVTAANPTEGEPLIVMCSGQSGSRRSMGWYHATKALPWGEALLVDYPGYGDSAGAPTIEAMLAFQKDFAAYLDAEVSNRPLVLWGHSLGGPICAAIARDSRQADAVVLETTAPSFDAMMLARKPWFTPPGLKLQLADGLKTFDVGAALANFDGPVLVLAAGSDKTFPLSLERSVAERLKTSPASLTYLEYRRADHMNAALNSQFAKDAAAFFAGVADRRS